MKLKKLLDSIEIKTLITGENPGSKIESDREITGVVYDSRKVEEDCIFVCLRGFKTDGHSYIGKAMEMGAAVIVVERIPELLEPGDTLFVQVPDTREALAYLSAAWFGYPARRMKIIGLTGTKGKTTTAHMIKKIMEESGHKTGMIGTIGAFIGEEKIPTRNTTPESYELHSLFAQMLERGCDYVVAEVSSQGLKQKRTAGIEFDYGVFLNISPDHIGDGEHKDFEEYLACKKLLFSQTRCSIINKDADYWQEFAQAASNVTTFSIRQEADYRANGIQNLWEPGILGSTFRLEGEDGEIHLNMPGDFNVQNAMAAICIAKAEGIPMQVISRALRKVVVKGRTQLIQDTAHFTTFIIDYAHNALSMESLLKMLKAYHPKRLVCLFGGGGNKPKRRRFDMGEMAGKYADLSVITMDNPRDEDMESINADIIRGLQVYGSEYKIIPDRREAIHYLIDSCGKDDIVALVGKGHEEYQEVRGVKYYFSEEKIIQEYLMTK